jgi:N6-adenosine-specific RNA methylase IME4
MKYSIILADPPWHFKAWSEAGSKRNGIAAAHYKTMPLDAICALPVKELAEKDCVLFLWATWPNMQEALEVIRAWGFTYKTAAFVWIKQHRGGFGLHMGLGYWTRANTEPCLLAVKGSPKRVSKSVRQTVLAPLREHSRKPDEVHEKILDLMGDLPRIELFARRPYPGWDVWGDEVASNVELVHEAS